MRYKFGLYWINQYIPSNNFTAELGFRFDYDYLDAQKFYKIDVWNDRGYDRILPQPFFQQETSGII